MQADQTNSSGDAASTPGNKQEISGPSSTKGVEIIGRRALLGGLAAVPLVAGASGSVFEMGGDEWERLLAAADLLHPKGGAYLVLARAMGLNPMTLTAIVLSGDHRPPTFIFNRSDGRVQSFGHTERL